MVILADVRRRLGREDAQLALHLISRGSSTEYERAEAILRDRGIDELLDDPRLLAALLESRQGMHASYPLFVYVVVRNTLRSFGEADRALADYVAAIIIAFGARGRAERIGTSDDEAYTTLAELSADADSADVRRSFLVRAHLGNYALWLSGIFPDHIAYRHWRRGGPDLEYYEEMGRRGFNLAATHRLAAEHGLHGLFLAAAERFGLLRAALNEVSDALIFPHYSSPDRLLREVSNNVRWRHG
jgi:hypothetical protein